MRYLLVLLAAISAFAYAQVGTPDKGTRYVLVADAQGGVWRMDTATGALMKCMANFTMACVVPQK